MLNANLRSAFLESNFFSRVFFCWTRDYISYSKKQIPVFIHLVNAMLHVEEGQIPRPSEGGVRILRDDFEGNLMQYKEFRKQTILPYIGDALDSTFRWKCVALLLLGVSFS